MIITKLKDYKGGWLVGAFNPSAYKTDQFEVGIKLHPKNEKWDVHYHKIATEINVLISGKMKIQDTIINEGDVFVLEPNEIADPIFLEDCLVVCIKTPSIPEDKYII